MRTLLLIIPILLLSSCFDLFSYNYWEDGDYYVTDNAGGPIKTLYISAGGGNGHGRVDYVDAIGSNDKYIIVRSFEHTKQYWIINKQKDNHYLNSDEIVEGPFNYLFFNMRKKKLRISSLDFSKYW